MRNELPRTPLHAAPRVTLAAGETKYFEAAMT
jgi:hypothetical protein